MAGRERGGRRESLVTCRACWQDTLTASTEGKPRVVKRSYDSEVVAVIRGHTPTRSLLLTIQTNHRVFHRKCEI